MKITVAKSTQTAIPELGKEEKTLYYLVIENIMGKNTVLNVGEKTYNGVKELIAQEERNGEFMTKHHDKLSAELAEAEAKLKAAAEEGAKILTVSKDASTKGKIA